MRKARKEAGLFVLELTKFVRSRVSSRPLVSLFVAFIAIFASVFIYQAIVKAASKNWVQTDWSGGADTVSTADDTHLTDWTKYYSGTNVDNSTAGEIKLDVSITQP